jgi:hypothetical protein
LCRAAQTEDRECCNLPHAHCNDDTVGALAACVRLHTCSVIASRLSLAVLETDQTMTSSCAAEATGLAVSVDEGAGEGDAIMQGVPLGIIATDTVWPDSLASASLCCAELMSDKDAVPGAGPVLRI